MTPYSLNLRGSLREYARPTVMGVINVTPDSFYEGSRAADDAEIARRAARLVAEGADLIDVGACSTRPGSPSVDEAGELERIEHALPIVCGVAGDTPVSIDTYRASVARRAVELGASIVNDVSGGNLDKDMFETVAELQVPYVLGHMRGTPADMMEYCNYEHVTRDVLSELGDRLQELSFLGVNDVIVDPGFGFSKTLDQNYMLLHDLDLFGLFKRPVMVGFSRKSMITNLLHISADDALNGTTALNVLALDRGASILRVHDVKAAREAVELYCKTLSPRQDA